MRLLSVPIRYWQRLPLYVRTLAGMALGALLGVFWPHAAEVFKEPSKALMGLVQMLAAPVAFFAITHALAGAKIEKGKAPRLIILLATNTCVAILIGMTVANTLQPGTRRTVTAEQQQQVNQGKARHAAELEQAGHAAKSATAADSVGQILGKLPKSLMGPFTDGGSVIGVIVLALLLGLALRQVSPDPAATIGVLKTFMDAFITILHWVVQLVPLIVMGVVAEEVGLPGKPDPAMYLETARRLGVTPARAVVVEDALSGVEAGRRGGFDLVIGVDRLGQAEALRDHGADVVVNDLSEVTFEE